MKREILLVVLLFVLGITLAIFIYPSDAEKLRRINSEPTHSIESEFL